MRIRLPTAYYGYFSIGVLCQSLTGPSDEICSGDDVTFSCVVSGVATVWAVSLGGDSTQCAYFSASPAPDECGPDDMFHSSRTDDNVPANNSSLRVDSITSDLNGTTVTCIDGGSAELIGSYNICIVGKHDGRHFPFKQMLKFLQRRYQLLSFYQPLSLKEMWV